VRCHKCELVATREKAEKNQSERRVARGTFEDGSHTLFELLLGGCDGRAHEGQEHDQRQHGGGEDEEDILPRHEAQKILGHRRTNDLPTAGRRCDNGERHGAVFIRAGAANDRENDAEARACNAKSDKDFIELVLKRADGEGREHEPRRIDQGADNNSLTITYFFGNRAEERLADAPCEVLQRDGEGELGAGPVELLSDGNLKDTEAGPYGKGHKDNHAACDEHRGEKGGLFLHGCLLIAIDHWRGSGRRSIIHLLTYLKT